MTTHRAEFKGCKPNANHIVVPKPLCGRGGGHITAIPEIVDCPACLAIGEPEQLRWNSEAPGKGPLLHTPTSGRISSKEPNQANTHKTKKEYSCPQCGLVYVTVGPLGAVSCAICSRILSSHYYEPGHPQMSSEFAPPADRAMDPKEKMGRVLDIAKGVAAQERALVTLAREQLIGLPCFVPDRHPFNGRASIANRQASIESVSYHQGEVLVTLRVRKIKGKGLLYDDRLRASLPLSEIAERP